MINTKKGVAGLQTIIMLILAVISLAAGIYMVYKAGLLANLQTIICTALTTWTMVVRGIVVGYAGMRILTASILRVTGTVRSQFVHGKQRNITRLVGHMFSMVV